MKTTIEMDSHYIVADVLGLQTAVVLTCCDKPEPYLVVDEDDGPSECSIYCINCDSHIFTLFPEKGLTNDEEEDQEEDHDEENDGDDTDEETEEP